MIQKYWKWRATRALQRLGRGELVHAVMSNDEFDARMEFLENWHGYARLARNGRTTS